MKMSKRQKMDLFDFPAELNVEAWLSYLEYRKICRMRKLKPISEREQIKWLIEQGDKEVQAKIIAQTKRQGWTGLFELKESRPDKVDWVVEAEKRNLRARPGESDQAFMRRVKRELAQ